MYKQNLKNTEVNKGVLLQSRKLNRFQYQQTLISCSWVAMVYLIIYKTKRSRRRFLMSLIIKLNLWFSKDNDLDHLNTSFPVLVQQLTQ